MNRTIAIAGLALAAVGATSAAESDSLLQAGEFSLSLFGLYLDTPADKFGGGIGLDYYLTRNLGIGAVAQLVDDL